MDRSSELKSIAQHELKRPNAAVGQSGLMALYEAMFRYLPYMLCTTSFKAFSLQELRPNCGPSSGHQTGLHQ